MPQNNKRTKKRLIKAIKTKNKHDSGKLSFTQMYDQLDAIMKIEDQKEREDAFVAFHCLWTQALSENLLSQRATLQSSLIIGEKNFNHPAMTYSLSTASGYVKALTKDILKLIDPEYAEKHMYNHAQLEEIHRFETELLKSYSYYNEIPKILKAWDRNRECYNQDIAAIDSFFRFNEADEEPHVYTGNPKNQQDVGAAEFYYKSKLIREKLARHNKVWHWLNYKKVGAYKQYLNKVDEALKKIGFNPEIHGESALNILKNTTMPPHDIDFEHVTDELKAGKSEYTLSTLEKISIAAAKADKALALDANPETSFEKKLEPFLKKYNLDLNETELKPSKETIDAMAKCYDEERNTEGMTDLMRTTFFQCFSLIVSNAMKHGDSINFNEIFNDARKIAVITTQHYTPFFEIEEFANIESPIYMKRVTEQWIEKRVDYFTTIAQEHWETLEDEAKENGTAVPEYVQKAREALTPEKIEELKTQAIEAVKQLTSDVGSLANEDRQFAKSLENNEVPVNSNDDVIKEQMSVFLDDDSIISEVSSKNEESLIIDKKARTN